MRVLYLTLATVFIDQAAKLAVKGFRIPFLDFEYFGMYHGQSIPVLGNFFMLTFVENPGMAFGIDLNSTAKPWLSIFSVVASIGLFFYLYSVRKQSLSMRIALALILGGAIGNLIDRCFYGVFYGYAPLLYGKVVDFFNFNFFDVTLFGQTYDRFPIFNIADAAVSIGVFILLIFYKQHQEELELREEAEKIRAEDAGASAVADEPAPENTYYDGEIPEDLKETNPGINYGNPDREGRGEVEIPTTSDNIQVVKPQNGESDNRKDIQI